MRDNYEIMQGLNVYYTGGLPTRVFLIQDNYGKTLDLIKRTLNYSKNELKLTFDEDDVEVQVLRGERYNGVMSLELYSNTQPSRGTLLEPNSGLWDWLKY